MTASCVPAEAAVHSAAVRWRARASLLGWLLAGQWRTQPGRLGIAVLAIAIGVALGLAIDLVNRSAVAEFGQALAVVNGEAHATVSARAAGIDEAIYPALLADPGIAAASPVIETSLSVGGKSLKLLGIDPMRAAEVTPGLLPAAEGEGSASSLFDADALFLSAAAQTHWGVKPGDTLEAASGALRLRLRVAGSVPGAAPGQRLAVMDIAALQWRLGWLGRVSRIDLRLADDGSPGQTRARWAARLPADAIWSTPQAGSQRMSNLSRAYRVNLSVLALVALLTGGFIVHATVALATARQAPVLALLAMLGAPPRWALASVMAQAALLGLAGAVLGVAGGLGLAALLLGTMGSDLGGGYFSGARVALAAEPGVIAGFALLGLATALASGIAPALRVTRLAPARAIRHGVDDDDGGGPRGTRRTRRSAALAAALVLSGGLLMALPAMQGLPLGAYAAIACWLFAGILVVGPITAWLSRLLDDAAPGLWRAPGAWLALQRLRRAPGAAAVALSGVVASFALSSAMAIMVDSFRHSVADWLHTVLPADLYGRAGGQGASAALTPAMQSSLAALPGVGRVELLRSQELLLDTQRPPVAVLSRPLDPTQVSRLLPLTGAAIAVAPGERPVWVSEAMVDLYGWQPGAQVSLPLGGALVPLRVAGVWRDYARQHGAVVLTRDDYIALTGDTSANDVAISLAPGADAGEVLGRIRSALPALAAMDWRSAGEIRTLSMRVFDRSFAVTYVLEAIAIGVGLFGVAATYAGQALARAREFGMLRHLGVTRARIIRVFALEAGLLVAIGVGWGSALGAAIAGVLVHRVNPQSFHWTMDMHWPWALLGASALGLIALGELAAVLAARSAAGESPVRAVREDW
jgi:putative ABC transport system permease protein